MGYSTTLESVDTLVFKGGGVKGIAYVGALAEISHHNPQFLKNIKHVGGTSAGSLTALLVALGYTNDEIIEQLSQTDLASFAEGWKTTDNKFGMAGKLLESNGLSTGEALLNWVQSLVEKKLQSKTATFRDLKNRAALYDTFKHLHVFATNLNTDLTEEISFETSPDTPIADAVRASMGFPLFFQPVYFKRDNDSLIPCEKDDKDALEFVDGGLQENYPFESMQKYAADKNPKNMLGFYLDSKEMIHHATEATELAGTPGSSQNLPQLLGRLHSANGNAQERKHFDTPTQVARTVYCDDCEVSTLAFNLNDKQKNELVTAGHTGVLEFIGRPEHLPDKPMRREPTTEINAHRLDVFKTYLQRAVQKYETTRNTFFGRSILRLKKLTLANNLLKQLQHNPGDLGTFLQTAKTQNEQLEKGFWKSRFFAPKDANKLGRLIDDEIAALKNRPSPQK